ncbi:MAG: transposase [Desulfamplus sp.]|nr:transposase [Desulfamplus sp.]
MNKPVQLIDEETCNPIQTASYQPQRYDYEYKRNGTAEVFMFTEPLAGFRSVDVREHKTGVDWAYEVKELIEKHYQDLSKIILVCDNYSTHKISSFYEAFCAEDARNIVKKNRDSLYSKTWKLA